MSEGVSDIDPVVVIGAGLVGASVGCALTSVGVRVHLRDREPSHAAVAAGIGAGTTAAPDRSAVGLVVVAVPPGALCGTVAAALEEYPNAVVTDVGSVKGTLLDELVAEGVELSRYVGSHPMAGSQHAGPVTAHADLFTGRTWVVCPHPATTPGTLAVAEQLGELCGARVVSFEPHEHDEAVAGVSHVPHLVSVAVAASLCDEVPRRLELAGQGVRDVTRIAGSDPMLWDQILTANGPAISHRLREVADRLMMAASALDQGRTVEPYLRQGVAGTKVLPGKHGLRQSEYARFTLPIPDEPGALARLFADADLAGVNIEDFSIEHDKYHASGRLQVAVDPEAAASFATMMTGRGWDVRPL
ncbi:prephenate dehydrogenase [Propioniferax innocua]|uniref:Prephenate dehydrogenase n=1 Tax=Propioniferax innocua TaxID=1753 RepID=A0A542ZPP5_9ACTN|nr:prephenate dehydrogenase [Propioniferax innocua]TQL62328.1 prephenate dehydrogenase [Propioniferax innocua]